MLLVGLIEEHAVSARKDDQSISTAGIRERSTTKGTRHSQGTPTFSHSEEECDPFSRWTPQNLQHGILDTSELNSSMETTFTSVIGFDPKNVIITTHDSHTTFQAFARQRKSFILIKNLKVLGSLKNNSRVYYPLSPPSQDSAANPLPLNLSLVLAGKQQHTLSAGQYEIRHTWLVR